MERKKHRNQGLSEGGKLLASFYNIGLTIPECGRLLDIYHEAGTSHGVYNGDDLPYEVVEEGIKVIQDWLDEADSGYILIKLRELRMRKLSAFCTAEKIVDGKYKDFFKHLPNGLPAVLAGRPIVPFSVASRRAGRLIVLKEQVIRETTSVKVTMDGVVPYGRDYQTIHALVSMMMNQENCQLEYHEDFYIGFTTTLLEICKQMQCGNPSSKSAKDAVFQSLRRLRGCIITWYYKDGRQDEIGGILSKVRGLREKSTENIFISIDADFIRLFERGYVNIADDVFYSLESDRDINLYCFLRSQKDYMGKCRYGGQDGMDLKRVYDWANLKGIGNAKPVSQQRHEMRQSLDKLKSVGEVRKYSISADDKLIVWRMNPDILTESPDELPTKRTNVPVRIRRTTKPGKDISSSEMTEAEFYANHY